MTIQEKIFAKIAEALLIDYTSVYYVNAVTNEYYWYSVDPEFHSLNLEQSGDGFFSKPHAPGGTAMNETYEGLEVVYTEDESVYTKRAAKVEDHLGQQLVQ